MFNNIVRTGLELLEKGVVGTSNLGARLVVWVGVFVGVKQLVFVLFRFCFGENHCFSFCSQK